ncbi:MAG TPA: tRNA lysidine(34) synthetase TilS [Methylomirabilota bacterium]|nr:tRNA lysidine(34) synthetase TilS [Methylomirabilota bacterium]
MTIASSLPDRALASIRRHAMLRGGDVVLVAVSGGADSVALLDVLRALTPGLDLRLHAAHVNHGLRPESGADEAFVADLCRRWDIPLQVQRVEIERAPGAAWEGLEAAARQARHAALRRAAAVVGAHRIATGHTADDQAETVIMRLLEGAGPRGLGGIAPVRGVYMRPLLEVPRAAIEAHLRARGIDWVEDGSNRDPRFLRNRVRADVLPFLAARLDPAIATRLADGAAAARALVAELEDEARAVLARLGTREADGVVLPVRALGALPGELGAEVLRAAAETLGAGGARRAPGERALRRVLDPVRPRAARLGALVCERSGRWVRVGPPAGRVLVTREWGVPGALGLPEIDASLDARRVDRPADWKPAADVRRAAFDADRLPDRLTVRARRVGDRFLPWGAPGERRLKTFLIDAGVPRWRRAGVPLVEAGGDIIWIAGIRRGRAAPVTDATRRILEVTLVSPLAVSAARE